MQKIVLNIFDQHAPVVDALKTRLELEDSLAIQYAGPFKPNMSVEGETAVITLLGLSGGSQVNPKQTEQMVAQLTAQGTAVIILSPYIKETERELALAAGARRYLLKTINAGELIAQITAVYQEIQQEM